MNEVVTIFLTIIVISGVILLFYILTYNNLQAHQIKINEAESLIDELLRKKYDLLVSLKSIITENTDVNNKSFSNLKNLQSQSISSFDFERKLTELNNLTDQIRLDYKSLESNDTFNNTYEDIYNLNERLEATKNFYNRYTSLLNNIIKKFPSNVIAKIHHMTPKTYFDGKDLFDENKEDFKI